MVTLKHKNGSEITVHGVDATELLKQGEYVRKVDIEIKEKSPKPSGKKDKPSEKKEDEKAGAIIGSALDD